MNQIDLPISWDDPLTDYTVTDFGGNSSSVIVDPAGLRGNVLQSDKTAGAQTWAGTTLELQMVLLTQFLLFRSNYHDGSRIFTSSWFKIRLKAEDSNDPTKSVETQVLSTVANAWEIIVFDFANQVSGTAR